MEIKEAYEAFILSRKASNFSRYTVKWYKMLLTKFVNYLEGRHVVQISQVDQNLVRLFMEHIKVGIRDETLHNFYRVIRAFFNWLEFEEYIQKNPMKFVQAPKREKKQMRVFTMEEIEQIMVFFDRTTFCGARNYAICTILFDCGIRRAELCGIKLADINHVQGTILIHGKGSKERIVPSGQTCRRVLANYMKKRNELLLQKSKPKSEYLFINQSGQKMGIGYITDIFASLRNKLNMKGERISPHTWRHTFAKTFLLNGGDIFSLQKILGHADISTTKNYINLNNQEVKLQHAKYNPLDNKDWML